MSYDRESWDSADAYEEWLYTAENLDLEERVARALCWKNGMNPDLSLGGKKEDFLWEEYVPQAKVAIEVCREFMEHSKEKINETHTET